MYKFENFINNLKQVNLFDIDFSLLRDWEYLTDTQPTKFFIYEQWIYVLVLINILIAGVVFRLAGNIFRNQKPKYYIIRRVSFAWITNTIFLLLYNLFRSQGVSFFSMRLFLVIIALIYLLLIVYLVWYWIVHLPERLEKFNDAQLRSKYQHKKK